MGCSASKATEVVVAPMPSKPPQKKLSNEKDSDSLRGSQASINSNSTRSDRESSARSTRTTDTTDSGVCELDVNRNIITENSSEEEIMKSKANERPKTPELSIDGTPVKRRKSPKQRLLESRDSNNNLSSLPPMGIIERPQSRGGFAFDVMLDTGNVKNRPVKLASLEKRKKRSKRRTKEEIDQKIKEANDRRKEHANQVIEKALISRKEKQLREARALDDFAKRLEQQES